MRDSKKMALLLFRRFFLPSLRGGGRAGRHLSVQSGADSITMDKDGKSYEFLYQWLRDHCRSCFFFLISDQCCRGKN